MTYQVLFAQRAKDDLRHYYLVAAERAPVTAARWLERFETALGSLANNPERCPLAPENDLVDPTIYQFFFGKQSGKYRALFSIEGNAVLILHIRRGGRWPGRQSRNSLDNCRRIVGGFPKQKKGKSQNICDLPRL